MKILLLEHPQLTNGTWMLYEGLVRVLGRDAITIFPPKPLFDGKYPSAVMKLMDIRWYRDVYKDLQNLPAGIPPLSNGELLTANDDRVMISAICPVPPSPDKTDQIPIDEDEVIELLNQNYYDLIVLGNSHRVPTIALARFRDKCRTLPPIIYFDAGERDEFNAHWWHVFKPALVFKNILTPELLLKKGTPQVPCDIYPMPMSHTTILSDKSDKFNINIDNLKNRSIDLTSNFGSTWETRRLVQQTVEKTCLSISRDNRKLVTKLDIFTQSDLLNSKISVSMRGSGRDTERYWDMPAAGCALICDGTMGCIHPFPFKNNESAIFYKNLKELDIAIKFLVNNDDERIRIAQNGHNHIRKYHSVEARALFFLGIINTKIGCNYSVENKDRIKSLIKDLKWDSELPDWTGPVVGFDE